MDGIVVGVNGTVESDEALDWALGEARARELPLTVVHVAPEHDEAALAAVAEERRAVASDSIERARARHGRIVEVTSAVVPGPAPDGLLALEDGAQMLVLGRRRRSRLGRRVLGSVSTNVVENARVPVTVVRRPHDGQAPGGPPPDAVQDAPRIVVGVDTSVPSVAALRHAATIAAGSTTAVVEPVFAWQITTLAPLPGSWGWAPPIDDYERFARERLAAAVQEAGVDLPGDRVRPLVVHGAAAKVLIERSAGADRLVVGARGLGGFDRLVLGSVSRQVLDYASCPVTVLTG
ncbi:universal stress protein [Isoptericola aurantiacus]|uniref:universal stress protein n=1 Tax=Isoptericola aurantiacus TaxID=3377839 RepID=UPI00383A29AB